MAPRAEPSSEAIKTAKSNPSFAEPWHHVRYLDLAYVTLASSFLSSWYMKSCKVSIINSRKGSDAVDG